MKLRVVSYNVRACADVGFNPKVIANDVTEIGADIVGLQEVDENNRRSNIDTVKILNEACGYDCRFAKAIDYKGGEYGHAIMSRLNVISSKVVQLSSEGCENRVAMVNVIEKDGFKFQFINTHLDHTSLERRSIQYGELKEAIDKSMPYIITGDFNTCDFTEFDLFVKDGAYLVNNKNNYLPSFIPSAIAIDNIVLSKEFKYLGCGIQTVIHSDHRMIWADVEI